MTYRGSLMVRRRHLFGLRGRRPATGDRGPDILLTLAFASAFVSGCAHTEATPKPIADQSSLRRTASGPVVGSVGQYGSHVWRGIPFAAPPVGDLRWRAPQPLPAWTATRLALEFGSPCVQYTSPFGGVAGTEGAIAGDEDCLYLNVFAPRGAADAVPSGPDSWPVMVWLHGGGNTVGAASFYDGGHLAAAEHVVVVTVNYRLGPLGWFRHAALRAGATGPAAQSGNFGTLDQMRALEWVRDNIAAFGGDPNNVTIFGESAGGQNVFALLLAPAARGLFHRAIVQSGGFWPSSPVAGEHFADAAEPGDDNSSNEVLARMLMRDGTAKDRAAAKARVAAMNPADIARYLRAQPRDAVMAAYTPRPGNGMIEMPRLFADGDVLPAGRDALQRLASANGHNRVPVIFGTNRNENKLFMFADPQSVRRYFWILPRLRDERMYDLTAEYLAAMWKATGADMPAAAVRGAQADVFVYRFDWDEEPTLLGADLGVMLGAAHGFEIPFVFGHFDLGKQGNVIFTDDNEPGRQALAKKMMGYWAQFARTGAPGRGGDGKQPEWTAWDPNPGGAKFLILDTEAGGGTRMARDALTVQSVMTALDADARFETPREKCAVLHAMAEWSRGFTKQDYVARDECVAFPYEKYPWS